GSGLRLGALPHRADRPSHRAHWAPPGHGTGPEPSRLFPCRAGGAAGSASGPLGGRRGPLSLRLRLPARAGRRDYGGAGGVPGPGGREPGGQTEDPVREHRSAVHAEGGIDHRVRSRFNLKEGVRMATIDADAHVVESEHTWDYMDLSDRKYRPALVTPNGA